MTLPMRILLSLVSLVYCMKIYREELSLYELNNTSLNATALKSHVHSRLQRFDHSDSISLIKIRARLNSYCYGILESLRRLDKGLIQTLPALGIWTKPITVPFLWVTFTSRHGILTSWTLKTFKNMERTNGWRSFHPKRFFNTLWIDIYSPINPLTKQIFRLFMFHTIQNK